jgi:aspartate carbamoyltransferase regulatory subunit
MKKELKVSAIKDGTVIDHVPAQYTFKIAGLLRADSLRNVVSVAANLDSRKVGKKGIIKLGGMRLSEKDAQKIAVLAPNATLSVIRNYKVISKTKLSLPDRITGIVKCINPNCISNREPCERRFNVEKKSPVQIRCFYCERLMSKEEIRVL